jgi:y4mF family transcriptional regulator
MRKNQHQIRSSRDLGQVIIAARKRRGLSQRQIADALGVSQAWVSRVEQGKQRAWIGQVLRLMVYLGITLDCTIQDDVVGTSRSAGAHGQPNIDDLVD